jgi:hypothetical protein
MSKCRMMKQLLLWLVLVLMLYTPALAADPTTIASSFSARFDKAFAVCDVPAVLELYEDGATAIYADVLSHGKTEIEAMVKTHTATMVTRKWRRTSKRPPMRACCARTGS